MNISPIGASLRSDELPRITDGIIWATLDAYYTVHTSVNQYGSGGPRAITVVVWRRNLMRDLCALLKGSFAMACT
jgi:hypothetical protein